MSNNNELTEENFWAALAAMPEPAPLFYRLYHDDAGKPLFYSMEHLPGNYIEITQEQYSLNATNVQVRDGKLVTVNWVTTSVLVPGDSGTPCHPDNVAIVVPHNEPHQCWSKQTYETN